MNPMLAALPPPTAPLVDLGTGMVTQAWYGFFTAFLARLGGAAGNPASDALALSLFATMADPPDPVDVPGLERGMDAAFALSLLADPADAPAPAPDPATPALLALVLADLL